MGEATHPVLKTSCLKYITIFRNQLPKDMVMQLFPHIVANVKTDKVVLHTYAANCIEKLLITKDKDATGRSVRRFDPGQLKPTLQQAIDPLMQLLCGTGTITPESQNEYLMRTVMR